MYEGDESGGKGERRCEEVKMTEKRQTDFSEGKKR